MDLSNSSDANFSLFKDCLAHRILTHPVFSEPETPRGAVTSASDLDEFTTYLAEEAWPSLPATVRELSPHQPNGTSSSVPDLSTLSLDATPAAFTDTLAAYGLADDADGAHALLRRALGAYAHDACAPAPTWSATRAAACELCTRGVPLTYHHLVPRATHAKVLKRKWHPPGMLHSVAWLCRPCHSAVHGVATNEELAREYYTMELLLGREDIQKWRAYAAKQQYGQRRG